MKIMVWNIEQFTQAKLDDYLTYTEGYLTHKRRRIENPAYDRLWYMEHVFNAFNNVAYTPDVIAVLEVKAEPALNLGDVLGATYTNGVINLLNYIKAWTGNANWLAVPPLKCNPQHDPLLVNVAQEAVAVFYNSATVTFEGPDLRGAAYPAPWNGAAVSGGTLRSGRVNHVNGAGAPVHFPTNRHRNPFLVDFRERHGAARRVRCLFIHTSPGLHAQATRNIADIASMIPPAPPVPAGTPDYYVACGDFNVNDWTIQASHGHWNPYAPLEALNYRKQLGTPNRSTHFYRKPEAIPTTVNPYGYMQREVIDNFLVRKTAGAIPAYNSASINCVNGSPAPWGHAMGQALAVIQAIVAGPGVPGRIATFRQWQNFWCIAATSDHAPIWLNIP